MSDVSKKQVEANRQNAKLGGVKTPEGKEVSKMNAAKHSILTKALTDEEGKLAADVQKRLWSEQKPQTSVEEMLIERIAVCYVRLQRATKAEAEQVRAIHDPHITETVGFELDFGETKTIREGYIPKIKDADIERLEKTYLRYDAAIERSLYRAIHELQRIQAARNGDGPPAPAVLNVELNQDG